MEEKIKKSLFEGYNLTPDELVAQMQQMAVSVKPLVYFKKLSPEELIVEKENFTQHAIKLQELEAEKQELMADLKERFYKLKSFYTQTLETIKREGVMVEDDVYVVPNVIDQDMESYGSDGKLLSFRPMTIQEQIDFPRPNSSMSIGEGGLELN